MPADVGQPAPELGLYDFDRQVRNLADHRGQTVVLAFFPAHSPAFAPPRCAASVTAPTPLTT